MPATETSKYRGVVVPMVSPFTPDGRIDESAVPRVVEHLLMGRVAGIFPLGTTGESASIAAAARRTLVAATVRAVAGRATTYAGVSGNCFDESLDAAHAFKEIGVDAVVAHVPSYFALSDAEIEAYYVRLADRVPLPLVLYNIPPTTHHSIPLDAVDRLRHHPNVVAIKDSANDPKRLDALLDRCGGRDGFPVLLGCSALFSHGLRRGAVGLVPSGAHLIARQYQAMYEAAMDDRWDVVDALQRETDAACAHYLRGRSIGQSLAMLKYLLERQGVCGRTVLPPLLTVEGEPTP